MKNVLIIEAMVSGHHSIYLQKIVDLYEKLGCSVFVAIPSEMAGDEVIVQLLRTSHVKLVPYESPLKRSEVGLFGLIDREFNMWRAMRGIFLQVRLYAEIDYVFLPYLDYCLYAVGLIGSPFGGCNFSAICMRPAFHYHKYGLAPSNSVLNIAKGWIFRKLLRNRSLIKLFTIDELLVRFFDADYSAKISYLPDPVDEPDLSNAPVARQILGAPKNTKVILVYGAIDERKNVELLLDSIQSDSSLNNWCVWIVGKQSKEFNDLLVSDRWSNLKEQHRVKYRNEFVTRDFEQAVMAACDVVWVAYKGHFGMSGVLVHAGRHSKPVIACKDGLIGWYAKEHGVGVVILDNEKSVSDALKKLNSLEFRNDLGRVANTYYSNHSWHNFEKIITSDV